MFQYNRQKASATPLSSSDFCAFNRVEKIVHFPLNEFMKECEKPNTWYSIRVYFSKGDQGDKQLEVFSKKCKMGILEASEYNNVD